ncbi:MAG: hypothetical protein K2Q10_11290, partial [Rhodospirillales bacterium]|nr:hypothetical protein [Rhodospirillales bacterium]
GLTAGAQEQMQAAQRMAEQWRAVKESLASTRDALKWDPRLSPKSPEDRLASVGTAWEDLASRAEAGKDPALYAQLAELSRQYLDVALDYNSMNESYADTWNRIQDRLQTGILTAGSQVTVQTDLLAAAREQLVVLGAIRDAVSKTPQDRLKDSIQAILDNPALERGTDSKGRALGERMPGEVLTVGEHQSLARLLGYAGEFGGGAHNAWMAADPKRQSEWNSAFGTATELAGGADRWGGRVWGATPSNASNLALSKLGYGGDFGGGGFDAWIHQQSEPVKSQARAILGQYGQPERVTFALGGVMTDGGPLDLPRSSLGGVTRTPRLTLFGEGRMPEAYVPLPDGRTIPVTVSTPPGALSGLSTAAAADAGQGEAVRQRLDRLAEILDRLALKVGLVGEDEVAMLGALRQDIAELTHEVRRAA